MALSVLCAWSLLRRGCFTVWWVPSETMGFTLAPPVSHYTGPGQSPLSGRSPLGAQVGVYSFSLRGFLQVLHGDHSLFYACLSLKCPIGLCCTATCSDECLDCHRVHSSHFQDSVDSIALTDGHGSRFLRYPAIDTVWRWPCLPRFRLVWPLAMAVRLVVFTSCLVP